jgi:hypothetical protein
MDIENDFGSAVDFVGNNRVIFDVSGNNPPGRSCFLPIQESIGEIYRNAQTV